MKSEEKLLEALPKRKPEKIAVIMQNIQLYNFQDLHLAVVK